MCLNGAQQFGKKCDRHIFQTNTDQYSSQYVFFADAASLKSILIDVRIIQKFNYLNYII